MEKESFPMNGGDGSNSYAKNSKFQEGALNSVKLLLITSIQENLELQENSNVFSIADLGCSVGPNTFVGVQTLIDAVELKRRTQALPETEFQVFFNDRITNDFNTLFKNLPLDRNYMVAGVPGSFYSRMLPKSSVNFMISSFALHWLSEVPEEVTKVGSPAWNKGSITYALSSSEVVNAFSARFSKDMEAFFSARAVELVNGGLMSIVMPCREDGTHPSKARCAMEVEALGAALKDMVNKGLVKEELLDSFNLPTYFPSPCEVKQVLAKFKVLTIEKAEIVYQEGNVFEDVPAFTRMMRAVTEGILSKHFGSEIMDELFESYYIKKMEEFCKTGLYAWNGKPPNLFLLVKRSDLSKH